MIWFLATGKSGLGHLRRVTSIAKCCRQIAPSHRLGLVTNATDAGLARLDSDVFDRILFAERRDMSRSLAGQACGCIVVDTAIVPGLAEHPHPLALIMREMPDQHVARFRLESGRAWDLLVVPNPPEHWMPQVGDGYTRRAEPVGWIYRKPHATRSDSPEPLDILVATGGGGTPESARLLRDRIDWLIRATRTGISRQILTKQAFGPRTPAEARLAEADGTVDPGHELHDWFARADIVISTAGYNSVLELATTTTPALLIPIPRSIDDQKARTRIWGPVLGAGYDEAAPHNARDWLTAQIESPARRPEVDLGPSGADLAARRILELL